MGEGYGAKIVYTFAEDFPILGGFRLTETLTTMWILTVLIMLVVLFVTRNFEKIPKGIQNGVEIFVDMIYNLTASTMGEDKIRFAPYIGTLLIFIAVMNLSGMFAVRPPTADLNTTLSLALMTFFMIHYYGIKSKGIGGYIKGFTEPMALITPINIIGEIATPVSLSFRLFGNLVGGMIIMSLIYSGLANVSLSLGISIPILQFGIPIVLHGYFDLFSGLLQTFIFAMLTMIFVSGSID